MRVLITGGGGLVGGHLATRLALGHEVHTADRHERHPTAATGHVVELSDVSATARLFAEVEADLVIHTAYSTADLDRDVVEASASVLDACVETGAALIHISTDAVFSGTHAPYREDAVAHPVHPYGVAKRRVEEMVAERLPAAAIVRPSLIVHLDPDGPDAATAWVVDANRRGDPVTLFHDEIRSAVRLVDLLDVLEALVALPADRRGGIWHVAGPQPMSRAELGRLITEIFELDPTLIRVASASTLASPRPRDVSLNADRVRGELHLVPLPVATVPVHGQANR